LSVPTVSPDCVLEEALNLLAIGVFVVDSRHRVIWMNRQGRALVDSKSGLSLGNGRLRGDTSTQTREIDDVLDRTITAGAQAGAARGMLALAIARRSSSRPLRLVAVAACGDESARDAGAPLAVVYVGDDEAQHAVRTDLLGTLFELTPTEARVAARLTDGLSSSQVAADLKLGTGTVRWHVKRIMARLDAGRQADLVRLVRSSPLGYLAI
jgi:DNA-binding CsgD family transcriptional regulator